MQRPLEIEAQLAQVPAFAREGGAPARAIDMVLPLARGLDRSLRKIGPTVRTEAWLSLNSN